MIGVASSVAFYNLQQTLQKPEEKPLVITVGGLQYTGNQENIGQNLLEQKYWTKFLSLPVDHSDKNFTEKSTLNISANASPSENFSSGNSEEEKKISKVFLFEDFYSYPLPWEEEDPEEEEDREEEEKISKVFLFEDFYSYPLPWEEEDPEEEDHEEEEKISKVFLFEDFYSYPFLWEEEDPKLEDREEEEKILEEKSNIEEEDDAEDKNKKILIPLAANDDVSLRKEGTAWDDAVSLQRSPQYHLFPNNAVSCAIEKVHPSALSPNDVVSSLDRVIRLAPPLLEHARKRPTTRSRYLFDPARSGNTWPESPCCEPKPKPRLKPKPLETDPRLIR
jgi:hypothetical protein